MSLPAGTRLGFFQIVSMPDAGGLPPLLALSDVSFGESTVVVKGPDGDR